MNIKTKDIASKSEVSIATVSRYLNKQGYVKQETRELIKKTIQEIKKQDKTYENEKNIAVVFPDLSNMFFTDVLKGSEKLINNDKKQILNINKVQ